jgi:hypothetical protein
MTRLRKADCVPPNPVRRVAETVIGAILGLVVGAIIAINLIITAGVERGYEASLREVLEENALVAVAAVAGLSSRDFLPKKRGQALEEGPFGPYPPRPVSDIL